MPKYIRVSENEVLIDRIIYTSTSTTTRRCECGVNFIPIQKSQKYCTPKCNGRCRTRRHRIKVGANLNAN